MTTDSLVEKVEKDPVAVSAEEVEGKGGAESGGTPAPAVVLVGEEAAADEEENHDPYFAPIVSLPLVEVPTGEDGETEIFKKRARLYRYAHESDPPEWKERGTGEVRIMMKETDNSARILMRREKTKKVCANHFIKPWMDIRPNCGSKKAWVWKTQADFADEEPKQETLAIKFGNEESAKKFFEEFDRMKKFVQKKDAKEIREDGGGVPKKEDEVQGKLSELQLKES